MVVPDQVPSRAIALVAINVAEAAVVGLAVRPRRQPPGGGRPRS